MITPGPHPNTFYRVSLKALIRNKEGEVLFVRENGSTWSLPGGGIDHGETYAQALARELKEEIAYEGKFSAVPLGVDTVYIEEKQAWLMWVVYEVKTEHTNFSCGKDADEIMFMMPDSIKSGVSRSEKLAYKFCTAPLGI